MEIYLTTNKENQKLELDFDFDSEKSLQRSVQSDSE